MKSKRKIVDSASVKTGNHWDIGAPPDGWPRPIGGHGATEAKLQHCGACGQWHRYGSTPDDCLDEVSRNLERIMGSHLYGGERGEGDE